MTASVVEAAAVPAVEAAAAPVGDYARAVEEAIISSQEKLENKSSRNARKRIATMFEDFRNGRNISVALMDDFLHTLERTAGRNGSEKKSASTMWTYRSHLIKYILQHYHVDYSNEGSYRVYISPPFPFCVSLPIFSHKAVPEPVERAFEATQVEPIACVREGGAFRLASNCTVCRRGTARQTCRTYLLLWGLSYCRHHLPLLRRCACPGERGGDRYKARKSGSIRGTLSLHHSPL